jgi:Fe-S-cluster containining protein
MGKRHEKILQKPVHLVILRPSHLQKLAESGQLPKRFLTKETPGQVKLPDGKPALQKFLPAYHKIAQESQTKRKQNMMKVQLRVLHNDVPALPKSLRPSCEECKTSACCTAFLVGISQQEYDSGLYGEYAVKLTYKDSEQFGGTFARLAAMHAPSIWDISEENPHYYLEGPIGISCPFLQEDGKCGIYDKRPMTCRQYTCVGDERITQEMRDGTIDIEKATIEWLFRSVRE